MDDCIVWTGSTDSSGYGRLRHRGRVVAAHRLAWEQANGPIPDGLCVLHHCDNPPCYNAGHLFLGTRLDNARDRDAKGRAADHKGDSNGRAKVSALDVPVIRDRLSAGESKASLARTFGVSRGAISQIAHGRTWRHA